MLAEMIANHIRITESASTWREAIRLAALPLLENGFIEERYIASMIESVEQLGPYIVIAPGFALPHARADCGVIRTGVSLLKLRRSIEFPDSKEVSLLVVLAANDAGVHVDLIGDMTDILTAEGALERLQAANTKEEILSCLKSGGECDGDKFLTAACSAEQTRRQV
ncbi:MAG: PTS sugar transporter subunit IIA [Treponema sp.]|nr:PTS sugar transporter subunit IIA [Treponema sp.]